MQKEGLKGYKYWLFRYYTENVLVIGVYQVLLTNSEITMAILTSIINMFSTQQGVKGEEFYG